MTPDNRFQLQPTLVGETIVLRPLAASDFDDLYAVASDPLVWEQHPQPNRWQRPVFEKLFEGAMASGGALLVCDKAGGTVGSSRFYDWDPARSEVIIGHTFLARSRWGTGTNREMKTLMLDHAFRWAETVWFHVGKHNLRSRKAMEKLGGKFKFEGVKQLSGVPVEFVCYGIEKAEWTPGNRVSAPD